jgi:hypothetical protein
LAEWYKIKDNAPWKLQDDSAKEKVRVDCYTSPRDKNSFMASGVVDFPPWVVLQVMSNAKYRKKYDINIDETNLIKPLATNTYAIY